MSVFQAGLMGAYDVDVWDRGLESFATGRKYRPDDPAFCMEFWCGWFDAWGGDSHHTRDAASVASELDDMLADGGSVNFYMFHGGTNFGFMAGANGFPGEVYTPDTTSYDYDGLLSECGEPTRSILLSKSCEKYFPDAVRVRGTVRKRRTARLRYLLCRAFMW